MKPDSLAFINVNLSREALPLPILAILLVGFFVLAGMLIHKASGFKTYSQDFPSQTAPVVVGLGAFVAALPIILSRMALGMKQLDGTGEFYLVCTAMAGVSGGMLAVKRFSSPEYKQGQAVVEAAKAAASPPQVNASGDVTVNANTTQERPVPAPSRKTDAMPAAGVKPADPNVVAGLTALADGLPFKGVPDDAKPNAETEEQGGGLG